MKNARLACRNGFIILVLFLSLNQLCLAQEGQEKQVSSLRPDADKQEEKTITDIEIQGNKSIATATILSHIRTKSGTKYSAKALSEDMKNLYNLGFFSDVQMDLEDTTGGVKVVFKVKEKYILGKIYLEGQRILNEVKIKAKITIKEGDFLDLKQLKSNIEQIEQLYAKYGFSLAKVEYKLAPDEKTNKADLYLLIDEGRRLSIRKISIKGNKGFSDRRLLKVLKTRKKALFNAGTYKKDVLEEDMERLSSFYKRAGYLDAKVANDVSIDYKRKSIYLTIDVNEGKRYSVGNVAIAGNENIDTDTITQKLKLKTDAIFTQEAVESEVAEIQGLYFEKGYIFAQVKPVTALDSQTGRVDVKYNIEENKVAYVDKIKIRGNTKTKDVVIRRELRVLPGEKFDGTKLKRSRERLTNLGYFEEVNYSSEPGSAPDSRDLVVDVKETNTGELSFGGGYSTVDQFVGFVEVAQKNFDIGNWKTFTGAGQDLRVRGSWGSIRQDYSLSFTEPWIFNKPISAGFDLYHSTRQKESDVGYAYDEKRTGGDIRLGKELSEYVKGNIVYRLENVDISSIDTAASEDLKKEEGSNIISMTSFGLTRDTRDNVFSPTRGTVLSGTVGVAGGPFFGDKDFMSLSGKGLAYYNPFSKLVFEFQGRAGVMQPYGNSDSVPIYERFYAGGANTIRGYNERKVGPIDPVTEDPLGGESMATGNIEMTYPILDFLKGAAFYDVGNVWAKAGDFFTGGEFKSSIGLGVRVKTPIGPIKLDYGWPLQLEPGEDRKEGKFHFSVSRGF